MRIMTGDAIAVLDRTMLEFTGRDILAQFPVAVKAQFIQGRRGHARIIGGMDIVAGFAFAVGDRRMLDIIRKIELFMTTET